MHIKELSALIVKKMGLPWCSWSDRVHNVPQHLIKNYMVICKRSIVRPGVPGLIGCIMCHSIL